MTPTVDRPLADAAHRGAPPLSPAAVLGLAAGAAFLAMLDATVANLAIPDLATDFPSSNVSDLSWVITAYAVVFAAVLAPAGRLADTPAEPGPAGSLLPTCSPRSRSSPWRSLDWDSDPPSVPSPTRCPRWRWAA